MRGLLTIVGCVVLAACGAAVEPFERPAGGATEWAFYGGGPGGGQYSTANEITQRNVSRLELAWVHRSGDFHGPAGKPRSQQASTGSGTSFQTTPIFAEGTLYYSTPYNRVFALDPESGAALWSYDPEVRVDKTLYTPPSRGVSSWVGLGDTGVCAHRIFLGTMDGRLIALDGGTGRPCVDFGDRGTVDLTHGISPPGMTGDYAITSPAAILDDLVIVGSRVVDGMDSETPSGVVRAFDARTGEFVWGWNAVAPGDTVYDSRGRFRGGTANVWSIISVDTERKLVIVPTGNPFPDFFGGNRKGFDHYSSSVVALDGRTGEVVWSFQTVHHDVWDFDVPAQPALIDLRIDGATVPAVVQVTKMGLTFVLHRETGEPLFEVTEKPVPQRGAVPEERLSPTQPFPARPPPLTQLGISSADAWGLTFWDRRACRLAIEQSLSGPIYTPMSTTGTVMYPSVIGGNNWGSMAIDRATNTMIAVTNHVPVLGRLIPRRDCQPDQVIYPQFDTPYCFAAEPLMSPLGIPCTPPPWGTISSVDLQRGELNWTVPMGTLGRWPLSLVKGGISLGGPLVTSTGLIFVGAAMDAKFRALDLTTGDELWSWQLPTTANAVPMTYRSQANGRQFVVVAAGGHFAGFGEHGDHLMAFALPAIEE